VWDVLRQELARVAPVRPRLTVVDVGGGTGGFAVPLAQAGHEVTVIDASPDALAALIRRADEAGVGERVRAVQGDADALAALVPPGRADLVLCHSLLEVVDSPAAVVGALAGCLRPGGAASVVVASRAAAVVARVAAGAVDAALALLHDPDGRLPSGDTVRRRYDLGGACALLAAGGLEVVSVHGVRVLADLVPGATLERDHEALTAFELAVAAEAPYRDIATQLHLLARRP
jgi:SAM-dependent methyltransferase